MGLGRLLLISLLVISISSLLSYFITPDIIKLIYTVKYQSYGKPELGYFIAVLESLIQGLKDARIIIIVAATSLLAGFLYLKNNSWIAGFSTYIILLILLLIFYYRFFNGFNIPDAPLLIINILFTATIGGVSSSIPGVAVYYRRRRGLENVQTVEYTETATTCPECGVKYDSKPLICVKCGLKLNQTSNIELESDDNCAK